MAINKDMLHAQTHSLFEKAGDVLEGVFKLKERIAELEKENESLKYSIATLETDLAMAESWRTTTPPVGVDLLLETGEGISRKLHRPKRQDGYNLRSPCSSGRWLLGRTEKKESCYVREAINGK